MSLRLCLTVPSCTLAPPVAGRGVADRADSEDAEAASLVPIVTRGGPMAQRAVGQLVHVAGELRLGQLRLEPLLERLVDGKRN